MLFPSFSLPAPGITPALPLPLFFLQLVLLLLLPARTVQFTPTPPTKFLPFPPPATEYCYPQPHISPSFQPITLPPKYTNDGVCDCCDGKDKFDGRVHCSNQCTELATAYTQYLNEQADLVKRGKSIKHTMIQEAQTNRIAIQQQIDALKQELPGLQLLEETRQRNHDEASHPKGEEPNSSQETLIPSPSLEASNFSGQTDVEGDVYPISSEVQEEEAVLGPDRRLQCIPSRDARRRR